MENRNGDVFVLMPYGQRHEYPGGNEESNFVYEQIIKPGIHAALGNGCTVSRAVDENSAGHITSSILRKIAHSAVVVVDITGWNPNVFFELGIRYALRKKVTILLAQEGTDIPFDIAAYRLVFYNRLRPEEAYRKIGAFIDHGLSGECVSDSLVFDTLRYTAVLENSADSVNTGQTMSWHEFMDRVAWVAEWMGPRVEDRSYRPDAVLGISNGGLVAADLIGKAVFARVGTPIWSLWAQRFTASAEYFENPYNYALSQAIRDQKKSAGVLEILVVDDHFGTGITALQAAAYLKKQLGEDSRILFLPLATARLDNVFRIEEFLPFNYKSPDGDRIFDLTREQFVKAIYTDARFLPLRTQVNRPRNSP